MTTRTAEPCGACLEDRIILVAGLWLAISPFALGVEVLDHPATVTALVCAAMLVSATAQAPDVPDDVQECVSIAVAIGLAASPWLLGYADQQALTVNALSVGVLVALCAAAGLVHRRLARPGAGQGTQYE